MSRLVLRRSKVAAALAGGWLLLAAAAFAGHLHSSATDPGDSGESAVLFILFTFPWSLLLPDVLVYSTAWRFLVYPVTWLFVGLNASLIYCVAGGVRRSGVDGQRTRDSRR